MKPSVVWEQGRFRIVASYYPNKDNDKLYKRNLILERYYYKDAMGEKCWTTPSALNCLEDPIALLAYSILDFLNMPENISYEDYLKLTDAVKDSIKIKD